MSLPVFDIPITTWFRKRQINPNQLGAFYQVISEEIDAREGADVIYTNVTKVIYLS